MLKLNNCLYQLRRKVSPLISQNHAQIGHRKWVEPIRSNCRVRLQQQQCTKLRSETAPGLSPASTALLSGIRHISRLDFKSYPKVACTEPLRCRLIARCRCVRIEGVDVRQQTRHCCRNTGTHELCSQAGEVPERGSGVLKKNNLRVSQATSTSQVVRTPYSFTII